MAKEMGVEKVSFLPYHAGGTVKRLQIGKRSGPGEKRPSSEEHIQKLIKIVGELGLAVSVGS
jgi:hypothetical protein